MGARLLIAIDDDAWAQQVCEVCRPHGEVIRVHRPEEACAVLLSPEIVDVLVMEGILGPEMRDLVARIRRYRPILPILILTVPSFEVVSCARDLRCTLMFPFESPGRVTAWIAGFVGSASWDARLLRRATREWLAQARVRGRKATMVLLYMNGVPRARLADVMCIEPNTTLKSYINEVLPPDCASLSDLHRRICALIDITQDSDRGGGHLTPLPNDDGLLPPPCRRRESPYLRNGRGWSPSASDPAILTSSHVEGIDGTQASAWPLRQESLGRRRDAGI